MNSLKNHTCTSVTTSETNEATSTGAVPAMSVTHGGTKDQSLW